MVSDEIHSKEVNGRIKSVCIRSDSMKGDKKNWQIQQLSGSWLCGIFEWEEISSVTLWNGELSQCVQALVMRSKAMLIQYVFLLLP